MGVFNLPQMKSKIFKYTGRSLHAPEYHFDGLGRVGVRESLIGMVQGKKASDLEERMSKSWDKLKVNYEFRARISSQAAGVQHITKAVRNIAGELEVDHLIDIGQIVPVLIDGEISHYMTPYQQDQDALRTDAIDTFGRQMGWHEAIRVPFTELRTQEASDSVARRIYNGTYIAIFTV